MRALARDDLDGLGVAMQKIDGTSHTGQGLFGDRGRDRKLLYPRGRLVRRNRVLGSLVVAVVALS